MPFFGAADRNAERRKAEGKAYKEYKRTWRFNRDEAKKTYKFKKSQYKNQQKDLEANLRFQEENLIQEYEAKQAIRDYEFETATRAYEKSVEQSEQQKSFNAIAEQVAFAEQDQKRADDLMSVMFEESEAFLDYQSRITGLKADKNNALVDADFKDATAKSEYLSGTAKLNLERSQIRSKGQFDGQEAIIKGMKAAGAAAARGMSGRSAHKTVLATMAESGALRSKIASSMMYAEDGVDLGLAQLKNMLVLDQTMVRAAKDRANMSYEMKSTELDANKKLSDLQRAQTRMSIHKRDELVRRQISNARLQADMNAEAQVLLQPEKLPALPDPRELYAKYDNPDTEHVEMLLRPRFSKFPKFDYPDHLPRSAFKGPRENVALSNFADVLKIGGAVATGVGSLGATGALSGLGITATGKAAGIYSAAGGALSNLADSFYPE